MIVHEGGSDVKKILIGVIAFLTALGLVAAPFGESGVLTERLFVAAAQQDIASGEVIRSQETYVNPVYLSDEAQADTVRTTLKVSFGGNIADNVFTTAAQASKYLRSEMKQRIANITFSMKIANTDEYVDPLNLLNTALKHTGVADEGDYLKWQYGGYKCDSTMFTSNGEHYTTYVFTMDYYTNSQQEKQVTTAVNSLLKSFALNGKSDYEKIKRVYDYICENVVYDHENLNNDSYMLKHTAYAAFINKKAVCQGYTLMLYRLLLESGVDCRVITGDGHAWNIVKIGNKYYNLDSTWDAGKSVYKYFLKSPANFTDHARSGEFMTAAFNNAYPMSSTDYVYVCYDNNHKYTTSVVAPNYLEQGYTKHTCTLCGYSYNDTYTNKLELGIVTGFKTVATAASAVKLTWNKVSDADGYIVYKYDTAKNNWVRVAKTTTNIYAVTGLSAGTSYRFAVKAYKTVSGKEVASPGYPTVTAETNPAVVSGFKAAANTARAIKLTWNKASGAQGYMLFKANNGKWECIKNLTATSYVVTGLDSATNYKFAVRSYRKSNGKTLASTSYPTVTTSTAPATVNFSLAAGKNSAVVKWTKVAGATGYIVYYKTSANGSWQRLKVTTGTSFTKTGLVSGRTYWFTVKAYRTVGGVTYNGAFTTKSVKVK